jgi:type 2 lantibiotic biosynthesis protein LanM
MENYYSPIRNEQDLRVKYNYIDSFLKNFDLTDDKKDIFKESILRPGEAGSLKHNIEVFKNQLIANSGFSRDIRSDDFKDAFYSLTRYLGERIRIIMDQNPGIKVKNTFEEIADEINIFFKENFLGEVLIFELKNAQNAGLLSGEHTSDRWEYFINSLSNDAEWVEYFLEEYPVLTRRLFIVTENLLDALHELFIDLQNDFHRLKATFQLSGEEPKIEFLSLFQSDLHNHGRSVHILQINETKILYKPKALDSEIIFKQIIDTLNAMGAGLELKFPEILSFDSHSWMEFVYKEDCHNIDEAGDFFHTQGKLTALFYLLGTGDLVNDNILACGSKPCYFDLEALITKQYLTDLLPSSSQKKLVNKFYSSSVRVSKLLPNWAQGAEHTNDNIAGGLVLTKRNSDAMITIYEGRFTDQMQPRRVPVNEAGIQEKTAHLPSFEGAPIEIDPYLPRYYDGFEEMYKWLESRKDILLEDESILWARLRNKKIRVVIRDTAVYSKILAESNKPTYLSEFHQTDVLFEHLWLNDFKGVDGFIIDHDIRQLNDVDVPYYYSYENEGRLFTSDDVEISPLPYFRGSSIEIIKKRLQEFGDGDYRFQEDLLRKSFNLYLDQKNPSGESGEQFANIKFKETTSDPLIGLAEIKDTLMKAAVKFGDEIWSESHRYANELGWIGETMSDSDALNIVSLLKNDVYDGNVGIALFFNQLFKQTRDNRYKVIVELVLKEAIDQINKTELNDNFLKANSYLFPLNTFNYPLNVLHLFNLLSFETTFNFRDIRDVVFHLIDFQLSSAEEISFDFMGGLAGIVLLLIDTYEKAEDQTIIPYVEKCASKLVAAAIQKDNNAMAWPYEMRYGIDHSQTLALGGFSHGTSGISYALLKAAEFLKDEVLKNAGWMAIKYDQSLYDPNLNGWLDLRDEGRSSCGLFYCHGAAGIALSRLLTASMHPQADFEEELKNAGNIIAEKSIGFNQSICHGDMGNLEVLYAISRHRNDLQMQDKIYNYLYLLSLEFLNYGKRFKSGTNSRNAPLGLFKGLAGFGYNLLRFYDWQNTPSVLILENDISKNDGLH